MKGSCEELCSAMSRRDIARREKVERDGSENKGFDSVEIMEFPKPRSKT